MGTQRGVAVRGCGGVMAHQLGWVRAQKRVVFSPAHDACHLPTVFMLTSNPFCHRSHCRPGSVSHSGTDSSVEAPVGTERTRRPEARKIASEEFPGSIPEAGFYAVRRIEPLIFSGSTGGEEVKPES